MFYSSRGTHLIRSLSLLPPPLNCSPLHTVPCPSAAASSLLLLCLSLNDSPCLERHLHLQAQLSYGSFMKTYQDARIHFLFFSVTYSYSTRIISLSSVYQSLLRKEIMFIHFLCLPLYLPYIAGSVYTYYLVSFLFGIQYLIHSLLLIYQTFLAMCFSECFAHIM